MFKIVKKDSNSRARTGILETAHGIVETPAYTIVGTNAAVRCLPSELLPATKTQLIIANTYHLWDKVEEISQAGGLSKFMNYPGATMTDSGGFQVFSLGFSREHGIGKVINLRSDLSPAQTATDFSEKNLVRVTDGGTWFKTSPESEERFLGPELSIQLQEKLGADIIMAFDECTSPLHDYAYQKAALERTHRWAKICLDVHQRSDQLLYGIIQGGEHQDLREASARYISSLPFPGFAIGGSFSKSTGGDFNVLNWTIPFLDENRPRHFLGIGKVEDIFDGVLAGIDTFDCVIPTREARHGGVWTKAGRIDIKRGAYANDNDPLEIGCSCPTCPTTSRAAIHRLFKAKDPLATQHTTTHNVYFFNALMTDIRQAIKADRLKELRQQFRHN